MKINWIIIFISCCLIQESYGQDKKQVKLSLMQGIWENTMNSDSEKAFTIINEKFSINFVFSNYPNELDFPLSESLEGFQDFDSGNNDSININVLKEDGLYYTIVDKKYVNANGWAHRPDYLTPKYFECDGENMSINGGELVEYEKIPKLPNEALKKLYYRGKKDNRNYIKDYLGTKVTEITQAKSIVYSEPGKITTTQLSKGDVVTVLEEKGGWIKVDYGEDTPGWIKKEYTNEKSGQDY